MTPVEVRGHFGLMPVKRWTRRGNGSKSSRARKGSLLPYEMLRLVVFTDEFHHFFLGSQVEFNIHVIGLYKGPGILKSGSYFHVTVIQPPVALGHMEHLRVWQSATAEAAQPALVVKTNGIHDERVSVPLTDRMSHPCWVPIRRMAASVEKNLTKPRHVLKKDDQQRARLHEFLDKGSCAARHWRRSRKAVVMRSVFPVGLVSLLEH